MFSPAGNHDLWDFENREPVGDKTKDHVALVYHTLGLIRALSPEYWFVENPTGRMAWFLGRPTGQVTYCQYGRDYQKRTDLWGDHPPLEYHSCPQGGDCHTRNVEHDGTSAVASMDTDHAERSLVPAELSASVRDACEQALDGDAVEQTSIKEGWEG